MELTQFGNGSQSSPCVLALIAPNLESLKIRRFFKRNHLHLQLRECPTLRSLSLYSRNSMDIPDPEELEDLLSQQTPYFPRIKLVNVSIASTHSAMFCYLRHISLTNVRITPTDRAITCENLTKLVVRSLLLYKPLKLRVPQLVTLNCDMDVLKVGTAPRRRIPSRSTGNRHE